MQAFETTYLIRFEHVDAAGIVYYPRYFQMISQVVEDWMQDALDYSYHAMHIVDKVAIPLVEIHCNFLKPSFLSERITFSLVVTKLGERSLSLKITAACDDDQRLEANMSVVYTRQTDKGVESADIPEELREKIKPFLVDG